LKGFGGKVKQRSGDLDQVVGTVLKIVFLDDPD